jgi:endo-1,4-beta-mannosidase
MLAAPEELTQTQIHDKMKDISAEVRRAENEYAKVADNQFQKNQEFKATDTTFYETELTLAQEGLMTYAKTLGLTEEQISVLLEESGLGTDDLRLSVLDEEAMANEILEGALHEFGNCARGEL